MDQDELPTASPLDTWRIISALVIPLMAQGLLLRRPSMVALTAKLGLDAKGVSLMRGLRARYGPGPLLVRIPGRLGLLVIEPGDVRRILEQSPEPFTPDNREKHGALAHFEPDAVIVAPPEVRVERRRFNAEALDTGQPVHRLAGAFLPRIRDEVNQLLSEVDGNELTWEAFSRTYWRVVRRVVLGDSARDDTEIVRLLGSLRADANWFYFRRRRSRLRGQFMARLRAHLDRAEPGSLAALVRDIPTTEQTKSDGQVPHWLFAFEAAIVGAYRALALLATHPDDLARVRQELAGHDLSAPHAPAQLAHLRATMLESLRLWPAVLVIFRDSTTDTTWAGTTVPAGTVLAMVSSYFNRDIRVLPDAEHFVPTRWLDGSAEDQYSIMPFSRGPDRCPGRELVLYVTNAVLAHLLHDHDLHLVSPTPLHPGNPMPYTLNQLNLHFTVHRRRSA